MSKNQNKTEQISAQKPKTQERSTKTAMEPCQLSQDEDVYESQTERPFLSTQLQSRIDDVEQEEEQSRRISLLRRFANSTEQPQKKTTQVRRAKTEKIKKPMRKKLSVTQEMIRLSGKPGKARHMIRDKAEVDFFDLMSQHDEEEPMNLHEKVLTSEEWRRMEPVLAASVAAACCSAGGARDISTGTEECEGEWWKGDDEPSGLLSQEVKLLYEDFPVRSRLDDSEPLEAPITLSQAVKPLFEKYVGEHTIIEISDSEILDTEDEGSSLIFITDIMTVRTQGLEGQTLKQTPQVIDLDTDEEEEQSQVKFKSPVQYFIPLESDEYSTKFVDGAEDDVVYDSLDEGASNYIEITRKRRKRRCN